MWYSVPGQLVMTSLGLFWISFWVTICQPGFCYWMIPGWAKRRVSFSSSTCPPDFSVRQQQQPGKCLSFGIPSHALPGPCVEEVTKLGMPSPGPMRPRDGRGGGGVGCQVHWCSSLFPFLQEPHGLVILEDFNIYTPRPQSLTGSAAQGTRPPGEGTVSSLHHWIGPRVQPLDCGGCAEHSFGFHGQISLLGES